MIPGPPKKTDSIEPITLDLDSYVKVFKALGNPHRLAIFRRLVQAGDAPVSVGELGADTDLAPSTVSHHLKELSAAGLITAQRQGQRIDCRVEPSALAALQGLPVFLSIKD